MTHARLYIFETYCRIHERIDLTMLAQKLGMEQAGPKIYTSPLTLTLTLTLPLTLADCGGEVDRQDGERRAAQRQD